MRRFTAARQGDTLDELWLLEHLPVYTTGARRRVDFQRPPNAIPVIETDRGGLITYHGPGQLVAYALLDLKRLKIGVRGLVTALEQATCKLLRQYGLLAQARPEAPGVYVDGAKIAFLGLRVRQGLSYHGLSLNVDLDLSPFAAIVPCGIAGLKVTRLLDLGVGAKVHEVAVPWLACFMEQLNFSSFSVAYALPTLKEACHAHCA